MTTTAIISDRASVLADVSLRDLLAARDCEPKATAMRCPLPGHEDRTPSASYTPATAAAPELWYCHVCGVGGSAVDLLVHADGLDAADAFAVLRDLAGVPAARASSPRSRASRELPSGEDLQRWAADLRADEASCVRLSQLRGWAPDVLARYGVGAHQPLRGVCTHRDVRVSLPVYDAAGDLAGVVCYQPNPAGRAGQPKAKAIGRRDLFPRPEDIDELGGWIVLCEGEADALCGLSLGLPCTGAPGVGKWDSSWTGRFAGRKVLVAGDCDRDGRAWARRIAGLLAAAAQEVRVAEFDASRDDGYDLTDWAHDHRALWAGDPAAVSASLQALIGDAERIGMDAPEPSQSLLIVRRASQITPARTEWLWEQRVPLGALTALAGKQGTGKSTLACALAAQVTRGDLPGDLAGPSSAILLNYEDASTTVQARLEAAGADMDRAVIVDGVQRDGKVVTLSSHANTLAALAREHNARMIVVDPVGAALGAEVNSHHDADVRAALAPLAAAAARERLAVLLVMHRRKGYADDPLDAVMGSTGFTAAPRSVLLFGHCPDDPQGSSGPWRVLAHAKSNLAARQPSLRYRLESATDMFGGPVSQIVASGPSAHDAEALTRQNRARKGEPLADAVAFLQDALADGPRPTREIVQQAKAEGISEMTLKRARWKLGVQAAPSDFQGGWTLRLPADHDVAGTGLF